jgi:hypothetical protein
MSTRAPLVDVSGVKNWLGITGDRFKEITSDFDQLIKNQENLIRQGNVELKKLDDNLILLQAENKRLSILLEEEKKRSLVCKDALKGNENTVRLRREEVAAEILARETCEKEFVEYRRNLTNEEKEMRETLAKISSARQDCQQTNF